MLRFLARFTGIWLIAAALVAGVVDGAKSIAASALVLTSLGESWAGLASLGRGDAETGDPVSAPWPLDAILTWLLSAPAVAVFAAVGVFLLAAGRRRRTAYLGRGYAV